jgi:hypothetical protein
MKNLIPLMQREWLQHRFAWALLVLVPLALAILPLTFGEVEFDNDATAKVGPDLALMIALGSAMGTTAILFAIVWITSTFITIGTPRRDHGDRSIEFWMSLPTGHTESLVAPMLVHLVLVPAAALVLGWLASFLVSALLVSRAAGFEAWLALPWSELILAGLAIVGRMVAGLPLATLWLLPLLLLAMLSNALFKRLGLPVLAVALGVGGLVLSQVFGQHWLFQAIGHIASQAGLALAGASGKGLSLSAEDNPAEVLRALPGWAVTDWLGAVQALATPAFVAVLVVAVGLLAALVAWRRRGAGHTG